MTKRLFWAYNPFHMNDTATTTPVKRTTRRKTSLVSSDVASEVPATTVKKLNTYEDAFNNLVVSITKAKDEFLKLQKEIAEIKESWEKEQKDYALRLQEKNQQEETERRREKEAYDYETKMQRRQDEDAFLEKKAKWERDLLARKDEIDGEKKELEALRKQVAGFDTELEKAVKEAQSMLQKELTDGFATEKKLREQEVKAEKDMFALRIANLTQENARQAKEIESLNKSLEDATRQLKDVAVKVIESSGNTVKQQNPIVTP